MKQKTRGLTQDWYTNIQQLFYDYISFCSFFIIKYAYS